MTDHSVDFTPQLRGLMAEVQMTSLAQLSRESGVPRSQLVKLRRGGLERIPLGSFVALSKVLKVSLSQILETFGVTAVGETSDGESNAGDDSPHSLWTGDAEASRRQWEKTGLDCLESLILQLPTAAFAAQNNPTAPAVRLLPLLKPLDQLLTSWEVEPIGQIGAPIAFHPQYHQWMGGAAVPKAGELVKVRYVGYLHRDRLLHRAKVGPL